MSTGIIFPDDITFRPQSAYTDAFGRFRTSLPEGLWEGTHILDKNPFRYVESTGTGGTSVYDANGRLVNMNVTTANGSFVIRQSRQYIPYQPGRGQIIFASGVMGTQKNNVTQRIGYFDENNGVYFEQTGSGKFVTLRTSTSGSVVNTQIAQADWNLDKLDGTGPSGITINWEGTQLFIIDFAWLGVGGVRFGMELNGIIIYCHQIILNNGSATVPWIAQPHLPVRYEIRNTGTTASSTTMKMICASVFSESGHNGIGLPFSANTNTSLTKIGSNNESGIIAIRANSSARWLIWKPRSFSVYSDQNDDILVKLYFAPTITGGSWNSVTNSYMEVNTTLTSFSNGTLVGSWYVSSDVRSLNYSIELKFRSGTNVGATSSDAYLLSIQALSTGNYTAGFNWIEYY